MLFNLYLNGSQSHLYWELQLIKEFRHENIVGERLSHLHNSNDGSIDLVLAILENAFLRCVLFFFRLLHLHLIDFDSEQNIAEFCIPFEGIAVFNVSTAWILLQYLEDGSVL